MKPAKLLGHDAPSSLKESEAPVRRFPPACGVTSMAECHPSRDVTAIAATLLKNSAS